MSAFHHVDLFVARTTRDEVSAAACSPVSTPLAYCRTPAGDIKVDVSAWLYTEHRDCDLSPLQDLVRNFTLESLRSSPRVSAVGEGKSQSLHAMM